MFIIKAKHVSAVCCHHIFLLLLRKTSFEEAAHRTTTKTTKKSFVINIRTNAAERGNGMRVREVVGWLRLINIHEKA